MLRKISIKAWIRIIFLLTVIGFLIVHFSKTKPSKENLNKSIELGLRSIQNDDPETLAQLFVTDDQIPKSQMLEFVNQFCAPENRPQLTFVDSKVIGNMGIAVLANNSSNISILARWNSGWKFYIASLVITQKEQLPMLKLSATEQAHATVLLHWAQAESEAGKSGIGSIERLKWYLPYVPDDLEIETFYETPSPSMDHEYMWKIKIIDTPDFNRFLEQLKKPLPNSAGKHDYSEVPVFDSHPDWWKALDFDKGTLHKHFVNVVSGKREKANLVIFLERDTSYLYIQAF